MNSPLLSNLTNPTSLWTATTPAALRGWAVGQILNATVLSFDAEQSTASLQVGGQQLLARINTPVLPGQQLTLRLASTGALPVLETTQEAASEPTPGTTTPAPAAMTTPQALRSRLPLAVALGDVIATLNRTAEGNGTDAAEAPAPRLQATLQSLMATLPTLEELGDPPSLKRAMQGSGLFLEALLARGTDKQLQQTLPNDFKAQLLRLASDLPRSMPSGNAPPPPASGADARLMTDLIRPTPARHASVALSMPPPALAEEPAPKLGEQVRGGVAQIEVNQLRHLSESSQGGAIWRMDLPVRDFDGEARLLHLQVEEEAPQRHADEDLKSWSMRIDMDLPPLGPLHAKISLVGERVHTFIWAERDSTLALLQANVDWLQAQLASVGLDASDVQCLAGRPVDRQAPVADGPLLDVSV